MGLLSKVKAAAGAVKARATSAVGSLRATRVGSAVGRVASSPLGRVAVKGGGFAMKVASPIAKISTAIGVGSLAIKGVKAAGRKIKGAASTTGGKVAIAGTTAIAGGAVAGALMKQAPNTQTSMGNRIISYAKANPIKTALAVAGAAAAGYGIYKAVTRKKRKKSKRKTSRRKAPRRKRSTRTSRSRSRTRRKRGYGTEKQYKRKGGLDVKYTKNGQPYVIQSNGRARFVKRSRR